MVTEVPRGEPAGLRAGGLLAPVAAAWRGSDGPAKYSYRVEHNTINSTDLNTGACSKPF